MKNRNNQCVDEHLWEVKHIGRIGKKLFVIIKSRNKSSCNIRKHIRMGSFSALQQCIREKCPYLKSLIRLEADHYYEQNREHPYK